MLASQNVDLVARQLLVQNDSAHFVEADEVERVLADVDADCRQASRLVVLSGMGCSCCWQPRATFPAGRGRSTAGPSH